MRAMRSYSAWNEVPAATLALRSDSACDSAAVDPACAAAPDPELARALWALVLPRRLPRLDFVLLASHHIAPTEENVH